MWDIECMKCILPALFLMVVLTFSNNNTLLSQEAIEPDWIPTLLHANASPIYQIATYHGWQIGWIPRGNSSHNKTYLNGIDWQIQLPGYQAHFVYPGLYAIQSKADLVEQFAYSEYGFGDQANAQYYSSMASLKRKQKVGTIWTASNARFSGAELAMNTGIVKQKWAIQSMLQYQHTIHSNPALGFKHLLLSAVSIDRIVKSNQILNLSIWFKSNDQTKKAMIADELVALAGNKEYNPNWGWKKGNVWFPNLRAQRALVMQFSYQKKWKNGNWLNASFAFMQGAQKESGLEWANTKDPRPDYYKYLPSYFTDSLLSIRVRENYIANPLLLQLNADQLEQINRSSANGAAFYIVNASRVRPTIFKASMDYVRSVWNFGKLDQHLTYTYEFAKYENRIADLLGGQYFYNYNNWVDDEGGTESHQYDLMHPDKKASVGELWGPLYNLQYQNVQYSAQYKLDQAKWEWSFGFQSGLSIFQRIGKQQNGLFPNNSIGPSPIFSFPFWGVKMQGLYKISGRQYFRSILFQKSQSPSISDIFLNPDLSYKNASFIRPLLSRGIDFSYFYRGVPLKFTGNFFYQFNDGYSGHQQYYHDYYQAFVYGQYGQANTRKWGIELQLETALKESFQLSLIAAYHKSIFSNNPLYTIQLANNYYQLEAGILQIENLPTTNNPPFVSALQISKQIGLATQFGLTAIYAVGRTVEYNFYRRAAYWISKEQATNSASQLNQVSRLNNPFEINFHCSKVQSFYNTANKLRWVLNVKNLLNQPIPLFAAEANRFDYVHFNIQKFPIKYYYTLGLECSLRLQLIIL